MKLINLCLLFLVIALTTCASTAAQTLSPDTGLNQVTLYWFAPGTFDSNKTDNSLRESHDNFMITTYFPLQTGDICLSILGTTAVLVPFQVSF